jgi:hypothetical protein
MRRALLHAVVFVAVLVAVDRAIFAGAMYLRDHGNLRNGADLLYDPSWDPSVVFFGDSRTTHNFDMSVIEAMTGLTAYNFGIDGSGTRQNVLMIDQLLGYHHHPKVIVLEADVNSLSNNWGRLDIAPFQAYLATRPAPDALVAPDNRNLSGRLVKFGMRWVLRSASIANRLPDLVEHWQLRDQINDVAHETPQTSVCDETPEGGVLRCIDYHGSKLFVPERPWSVEFKLGGTVDIDADQMALFERAVALARAHGAYLLLEQTPYYLTDTIYPPDDTAPVEQFFCELARANPNVLYARLSHLDGIDHDPALYYDPWHFDAAGARIMSEATAPLIADLAHGYRPEACILR